MADATIDKTNTIQRSWGQWMFYPFLFIAGYPALGVGLFIILLTAVIGSIGNMHFDGVLDVHSGRSAPISIYFLEGVIDWLCMAVMLIIFGFLFSRSSFRLIDVIGTQALARWPFLLTSLAVLPGGFNRYGQYLAWKYAQIGSPVTVGSTDVVFFGLGIIISLLMIVWMVALMYRAYTVSCGIKGGRAIGSFIAALILAEVISKVVLWRVFLHI